MGPHLDARAPFTGRRLPADPDRRREDLRRRLTPLAVAGLPDRLAALGTTAIAPALLPGHAGRPERYPRRAGRPLKRHPDGRVRARLRDCSRGCLADGDMVAADQAVVAA